MELTTERSHYFLESFIESRSFFHIFHTSHGVLVCRGTVVKTTTGSGFYSRPRMSVTDGTMAFPSAHSLHVCLHLWSFNARLPLPPTSVEALLLRSVQLLPVSSPPPPQTSSLPKHQTRIWLLWERRQKATPRLIKSRWDRARQHLGEFHPLPSRNRANEDVRCAWRPKIGECQHSFDLKKNFVFAQESFSSQNVWFASVMLCLILFYILPTWAIVLCKQLLYY